MKRYRGRVFPAQDLQSVQRREPAESIPGPGKRPTVAGTECGVGVRWSAGALQMEAEKLAEPIRQALWVE